jgi:acyl-CoA thioesterase
MGDQSDKQILAQQVGGALVDIDQQLMALLGIELARIEPGLAICTMVVRADMVNSHGYCQGGLLFSLADHAFAYACMSGNQAGVTLSASVIFSRPARTGDQLRAEARVTSDGGRTATCLVEVLNQDGELLAQFQGVNYRVNRPVLPH